MCLVTKMIAPQKARKNIVCYKVFERRLDVNSKCLCTPYYRIMMTLGHEEKQEFAMPKSYNKGISKKLFKLVGKGFFHAFTKTSTALRKLSDLHTYGNSSKLYVIVECEIPKDSLYFKDKYGDQICSTSIKPIKIIHTCV